jgi:hypothetical protein
MTERERKFTTETQRKPYKLCLYLKDGASPATGLDDFPMAAKSFVDATTATALPSALSDFDFVFPSAPQRLGGENSAPPWLCASVVNMFVDLHARSAFSFLESASIPEELAGARARFDMPAMAIDDFPTAKSFVDASIATALPSALSAPSALSDFDFVFLSAPLPLGGENSLFPCFLW